MANLAKKWIRNERSTQIEALRRIVSSDPAAHVLNASALAERLFLRGVRVGDEGLSKIFRSDDEIVTV